MPSQGISFVGGIGQVISLAANGVKSDADLSVGSTNFGTDQTAAIQAILNRAQTAPITIFWDVKTSVTGLHIYGNTTIIATDGCGAILRTNSNTAMFKNSNPIRGASGIPVTQGTGTPATLGGWNDTNITIRGGIWNGNGNNTNQTNAGVDFGLAAPTVNSGNQFSLNWVRFFGVKNVLIEGVQLLAFGGYGIWLANWQDVRLERIFVDYTGGGDSWGNGTDPVHLNGPGTRLFGEAWTLKGGDNGIAVNADNSGVPNGTFPTAGNITDVHIKNVYFNNNKWTAIRLTTSQSLLDRVVFENLRGASYGILRDEVPSGVWLNGNGNLGTVTLKDINVDNNGNSQTAGIYHNCQGKQLNIQNFVRNSWTVMPYPSLFVDYSGYLDQININGWYVNDTINSGQEIAIRGYVKQLLINNVVKKGSSASAGTILALMYNNSSSGNVICGADNIVMSNINADTVDYIVDIQNQQHGASLSLSNMVHTNGTKGVSVNIDGLCNALKISNVHGPTSAYGGSQVPIVQGGDFFSGGTVTNSPLNVLHFSADASTYADSGFATAATTDAAAVLGWKESNSIYNATTDATHNPILKLNIQNALPALQFNGTSSNMTMGRTLSFPKFTILCAVAPLAVASLSSIISSWMGDSSNNAFGWFLGVGHTSGKFTFYTGAGTTTPDFLDFGTAAVNTPTIVALTFDGTNKVCYQGSAGTLTQIATDTANISVASYPKNSPIIGALLNFTGTPSNFANMNLFDVRVWQQVLSSTDLTSAYNTMKTKWNITG